MRKKSILIHRFDSSVDVAYDNGRHSVNNMMRITILWTLALLTFSCVAKQESSNTVDITVNLVHADGTNSVVQMGVQAELQTNNERNLSESFTIEEVIVNDDFTSYSVQLLNDDRYCYIDRLITKVACHTISTGAIEYHGAGKGRGPAELEEINEFGLSESGSALLYDRNHYVMKGLLDDKEQFLKVLPLTPIHQIVNYGDFSIVSHGSRVDSATVSIFDHKTVEFKPIITNFESLHGAQPGYMIILAYYDIGKIDDDHYYGSNKYTGFFSILNISGEESINKMLINSTPYIPPVVHQQTTFPGGAPELSRNNYQFDLDNRPPRKYSFTGSDERYLIFCQYDRENNGFYFDHYDAKTGDYLTSFSSSLQEVEQCPFQSDTIYLVLSAAMSR